MKSRMDRYYNEEVKQRTTRNDSLYDDLYREKQSLSTNVTILDNVNEIDVNRIKDMVNNREEKRKIRDFAGYGNLNLIDEYKEKSVNYDFKEVDESNYDINKVIEKKRSKIDTDNKIRNIELHDYELLKDYDENREVNLSEEFLTHEHQLKELLNTITNISEGDDDLFSNLREDETDKDKTKNEEFFTKTSKIVSEDLTEDVDFEDLKDNSKVFVIIACACIIIAVAVVVYLKILS